MTAPSLCTSKYFRAYFQNGTLPEPGTVCPVEATLFGAPPATKRETLSVADKETLDALKFIGLAVLPITTAGGIYWSR
jgi:hypothetical protein